MTPAAENQALNASTSTDLSVAGIDSSSKYVRAA